MLMAAQFGLSGAAFPSAAMSGTMSGMASMQGTAAGYKAVADMAAFRKELASKTSALTTIQAKFVQTKYLSVFSREMKSEGRFYWQKTDKICLDYRTPVAYEIVINGDKIKTVNAGKASVIDTKGNPMMDQMSTLITSCMTGDLSKLGADFAVNVEESAADYRLTIVPKSKTVRAYIDKMVILLNRKDLSVNRLTMYENASDYTMYDFTDKKFNAAIPQTVFNMR